MSLTPEVSWGIVLVLGSLTLGVVSGALRRRWRAEDRMSEEWLRKWHEGSRGR